MSSSQRKRRYVDPAVQRALVFQALRHGLLFFVVSFFFVLLVEVLMGEPHSSIAAILLRTWYRCAPVFLPMLMLAPVFINDYIGLSNRFVGPMVRLRRELGNMAEGQPGQRVNFRKGDFWQDVGENFNRVVARFEQDQTTTNSDAEDEPDHASTQSRELDAVAT